MTTENAIIWEGSAVFVAYDAAMAAVLGPYAVCVMAATHAVIVGRTSDKGKALRVAQRLDRYPNQARRFAGVNG